MAIGQKPLALRRDLVRIFGEDRLVAVIRTATPEIAEHAARAMAEAGVRLVEITLTVPDAYELIAKLATDDSFAKHGAIVGAGTVLSGAQAEDAVLAGARHEAGALARAIRRLHDDPGLRARLGTQGREDVRAYTAEAWAEGIGSALQAAYRPGEA